jgi:hypothetical protein
MTQPKATHATTWEDDGMVGYICSRAPQPYYGPDMSTGYLSRNSNPDGSDCPVCGQRLRLVWDVRIEEVEPERDPQKQAGKAEVSTVEEEAQAVIANLRADLGECHEVLKRTVLALRNLHRATGHPGIDHRVSGIVASLADDIERTLMDKGA